MKTLLGLCASLLALATCLPMAQASPCGPLQAAGLGTGNVWGGYGRSSGDTRQRPHEWDRRSSARRIYRGHSSRSYGQTRAPQRVFVPGRWVTQSKKVWVSGWSEKVWQPPAFETRLDSCGRPVRFQLSIGGYRHIQHPGRWESRNERVWQGPRWELRY